FVRLGRGVLAGLAAQAVFLKSDLLHALRIAKKLRETPAILRQRSRPAGFPAVLLLDADQLAENLVPERGLRPGQEVVDVGLAPPHPTLSPQGRGGKIAPLAPGGRG